MFKGIPKYHYVLNNLASINDTRLADWLNHTILYIGYITSGTLKDRSEFAI